MKKLVFISAILMVICFVCINAQNSQPKLNQLELSKKLVGGWQLQNAKDTIMGFEMSLYKNAVLETMYRTVNGVKELTGAISFNYDPKIDKFKGFWVKPDGRLDSYSFKFTSEMEFVFEWVADANSNKLMEQNKFIFADQDHIHGSHYNSKGVQISSSKWARTNSVGIDNELQTNEIAQADNQIAQAILNKDIEKIGSWHVYNSKMIFQDGTIQNGKKEILSAWKTAFQDDNFSVKRKLNDVMVLGSGSAYTMGSWERRETNAEGKVMLATGKYVEVWTRQEDGKWKVLMIKL